MEKQEVIVELRMLKNVLVGMYWQGEKSHPEKDVFLDALVTAIELLKSQPEKPQEYCSCKESDVFMGNRLWCRKCNKPLQKPQEEMYPCKECGKLRTKDEGGTTFTVCDECWEKSHKPQEYCECIGIRINNKNDKNCFRCGKSLPEPERIKELRFGVLGAPKEFTRETYEVLKVFENKLNECIRELNKI